MTYMTYYIPYVTIPGTNAIMNSCSQFNTSEFQSRRDDFKSDLLTQITTNFVTVSCEVTDLQVGGTIGDIIIE